MEISMFSSEERSRNKIGAIIFLALGVAGFLDSGYLALESYRGSVPICTILTGCQEVLASGYSKVAGVPLSYLGVLYYSIVIAGSLLYLDIKNVKVLHALSGFTMIGILASVYFLYLQFFVIQALCIYCLFSAMTSTLLFINGLYIFIKTEPKKTVIEKVLAFFRRSV